VPDFAKFTGEDTKTTYEHVGQFLARAIDFGIMDVHKIRLFPVFNRHYIQLVHILSPEFHSSMGAVRTEVP
jgi:hypothetical protein